MTAKTKTTQQAAPGHTPSKVETKVKVPKIINEVVEIRIRGIKPGFLAKRWATEDEQPKGEGKKAPKIPPEEQVELARYQLDPPRDDCTDGIPAGAPGKAIVRAAQWTGYNMTEIRGALYVIAEADSLIPIHSEPYVGVGHRIQTSKGESIMTYRPLYPAPWYARIVIEFNKSALPREHLVELLNLAGFGVGVGAWRPERDGIYGRFEVVSPKVYDEGVAAL